MFVNVSPFLCYSIGFSIALVAYFLGWSDLYPELSPPLLAFLIVTILIHLLFARMIGKKNMFSFTRTSNQGVWPYLITAFLYVLWILEFVYADGIPLVKILLREPFDYELFGIPTLHVFAVTFSSFYTVYLFHGYLSEKRKNVFALVLINLFSAILIYNRGMFLFNLSSCALLFLIYAGKINCKHLALASVAGVVLMFFFGVMGNIRSGNESRKPYNNNDFLKTGGATDDFKASIVPKEFFWSYIYVTSPLANLQQNIDHAEPEPGLGPFLEMFNNEVMMDFISKRINRQLGIERASEATIPGPFNVSTIYSRSFSYMGWIGMLLLAFVILLVPFVYLMVLPAHTPFFLSGWAIICTMFLFMCFDNTIRFTGLSFQLAYPISFFYGSIIWEKMRRVFVNKKVTSV